MKPSEYAKAIVGGLLAGLGALYLGLDDEVITVQEWVGVATTTIATFAGVWGVPNAAKIGVVTQHVMTVTKQDVTPEHVEDQAEAPGGPVG